MSDRFNPYESEFGPGEKPEFVASVNILELIEDLNRVKELHCEGYLKSCPHCGESVIFYRDDWFFCQQHNFVKVEV